MVHQNVLITEHAKAISQKYIRETLEIYRPQYVALTAVEWDHEVLVGHVKPSEYPFTRPGHIGYVTAAMTALYLSQLAYVFTRLKIEENQMIANGDITTEHFFSARDRGDLVITQLNLSCRQKIPVSIDDLPVLLWQERVHKSRTHILCKFAFDFRQGAFSGDAIMGMPLPER